MRPVVVIENSEALGWLQSAVMPMVVVVPGQGIHKDEGS
jgi:hypothetical protein